MTVTPRDSHNTETLIKEIEKALGEKSIVRQLGNSKLLQINNLDKITAKEVSVVIQNALGVDKADERLVVRNLYTGLDRTQSAHVLIPESDVQRAKSKLAGYYVS